MASLLLELNAGQDIYEMSSKPANIVEIFLQPGEYYFGDRHTRIRTLLGSCVAISLWHPKLLIGGMCHYLLPARAQAHPSVLSGKYADEAMHLLLGEIKRANTQPKDYEVKMFGGGDMFPAVRNASWKQIGSKNAEAGHRLLSRHGLHFTACDLGGVGHRNIIFDVWNGHVWVRKTSVRESTQNGHNEGEAK